MIYIGLKDNSNVKGNLFITTHDVKSDPIVLFFDDCKDYQKFKTVSVKDFSNKFEILSKP